MVRQREAHPVLFVLAGLGCWAAASNKEAALAVIAGLIAVWLLFR